jgi:hypothetical protein
LHPTRYFLAAFACAAALGVTACGSSLTETSATVATPPQATPAATSAAARKDPSKTTAGEPGCIRKSGAVLVSLTKYPHIGDHVRDAIRSGQPVILHVDRAHADEHRGRSTDDLPAKRGYDRDEYPPAMSREGGESAHVRYVKSSENRAAGASMGGQLRRYRNGQAFRLKVAKPSRSAAKPTAPATPTPDAGVDDSNGEEPVSYANCAAARAAGAAPLATGDPGYAGHLDRDGDGVACEN